MDPQGLLSNTDKGLKVGHYFGLPTASGFQVRKQFLVVHCLTVAFFCNVKVGRARICVRSFWSWCLYFAKCDVTRRIALLKCFGLDAFFAGHELQCESVRDALIAPSVVLHIQKYNCLFYLIFHHL